MFPAPLAWSQARLPVDAMHEYVSSASRPPVYALIAPAMEKLAQRSDCDPDRSRVEFYRRHDVIDLLQPVI